MITHTAAELLVLGVVAVFFQKNRLQRIWAFLLWAGFAGIVFSWLAESLAGGDFRAVYRWIVSPVINVDLVLKNNAEVFKMMAAVFVAGGFALFYNIFYDLEKERLRSGGLYLLLTAAMIFLICAENMMQLLIGACLADILGFYLIRDTMSKQKYVFYNLLADMALMLAFALLWGKTGNLGLAAAAKFAAGGGETSLAPVFLLGAAAAKSGLFLFHNNLLDLKRVCFTRAMFVMLAGTPLAGAIILYKAYAIVAAGGWMMVPATAVLAALTLLWALGGALLADNVHAKILYLNLAVYGMLYGVLSADAAVFPALLPAAALFGTVTTLVLMLPVAAASNEVNVSGMGQFYKMMKLTLGVSLLAVWAEIPQWAGLAAGTASGQWWIWAYGAVQLLALAHVLGQIYLGASRADDRVWAMLKNPNFFYLLPLLLAAGLLSAESRIAGGWPALCACVAFLLVFLTRPLRFLDRFYDNETVQTAEPVMAFYNAALITPLTVLGRILWLLVDFLLIEKTFVNTLNNAVNALVRLTARVHTNVRVSGLAFTAAGLAAAAVCYYVQGGR